MGREGPLVLLDACCLINLLASGRSAEILAALPYRFATSRLVATREVPTLSREPVLLAGDPLPTADQDAISALPLLDLTTDDEIADFVRLARELDDGEASVGALAIAHGGRVATDDRKALRVLGQAGVASIQTPELLFEWARRSKATEREIRETLRAVRSRGRFHPRRDAPHFAWWDRYLR